MTRCMAFTHAEHVHLPRSMPDVQHASAYRRLCLGGFPGGALHHPLLVVVVDAAGAGCCSSLRHEQRPPLTRCRTPAAPFKQLCQQLAGRRTVQQTM